MEKWSKEEIMSNMIIWYQYQERAQKKNDYYAFRQCEKELDKLRELYEKSI